MNEINEVRIVLIDAKGSDAVIGQALAGVLDALRAPVASPPLAPLPIAPEPKVLSVPKLAPPVERAAKPQPQPKAKAAPVVRMAVSEVPPDAGTRALILAALAKRPMPSGDVMKATGLNSSKVYSMLNILRKEGIVESRESEESLYPVQHLVKAE